MNPQETKVLATELAKAKESYNFERDKNDSRSYAYLEYLQGRIDGLSWVSDHLEFYAKDSQTLESQSIVEGKQ